MKTHPNKTPGAARDAESVAAPDPAGEAAPRENPTNMQKRRVKSVEQC